MDESMESTSIHPFNALNRICLVDIACAMVTSKWHSRTKARATKLVHALNSKAREKKEELQ
jgi:hypothetical protein